MNQTNEVVADGASSEIRTKPRNAWQELDPSGLYERAGTWLLVMPQVLAWYGRLEYRGHTLNKRDGAWLLIVRAVRAGNPVVCFTGGDSALDCVRTLAYDLRGNRIRWKHDKYASI